MSQTAFIAELYSGIRYPGVLGEVVSTLHQGMRNCMYHRFQSINIKRTSVEGLVEITWKFDYRNDEHALFLTSYVEWRRASKRHKFVMHGSYWMCYQEARNLPYNADATLIEKALVPLPADVIAEARAEFVTPLFVGMNPQD